MSSRPQQTKRRWIRPLPKTLINKIAAGEVVERPAAVVKELVENSLDADATQIDITIEKSGGRLIKIVDNGCGIDEDQIEIAFSRHATSKISSFDELHQLLSYGFRGEALPSIASVSRLRMVSRTPDADSGIEVIYEGGVLQSRRPVPAPPGTTIEVENLFFNTPARRKFLKSDATETRHLSRTATALAIGRNDVGFSYTSNSRNMFSVPPGQTLRDRVTSLLAPDKKLVEVAGETTVVKVRGFIGPPDAVQGNRFGQYLFINNRSIQSPTLSHALAAGFGEMLPSGNFPIGALHLEVDPSEVDVNVHPSKIEVRLSHEREIHEAIRRITRESLRSDGIIPTFRTGDSKPGEQRPFRFDGAIMRGAQGQQADRGFLDELHRSVDTGEKPRFENITVDRSTGEIIEPNARTSTPTPEPSEPTKADTGPSHGFRLVGRFSELYLILQAGDDMYIVDQHTAHERVLYELCLERVEKQSLASQSLLFPVTIELSPEQYSVFEDAESLLNNSGFAVSEFGGRTIHVNAIPSLLSKKSPEKLVVSLLDDIASLKQEGFELKKAIAQSMACRAAVMSGDRLSDREATGLLEQLLECENKYTCPHGRPTFIRISKSDLDKQFGRE